MEQAQREHDEIDDLPGPSDAETDDDETSEWIADEPEPQGVADADEVLLAQLDENGEDVGLDLEAGVVGGLDASTLVDADDERGAHDTGAGPMDEDLLPVIEAAGDEDGWLEGSEGDRGLVQADLVDEETEFDADDGGLEGTDDSLHEGLEESLPPLFPDEDDADTAADELEQELIRELGPGL